MKVCMLLLRAKVNHLSGENRKSNQNLLVNTAVCKAVYNVC
ncbi:hypothetical protein HMPREF0663_10282 [Hoylesella oralis ATCC 33269]|uniref:Uncharacterized protein n=1 Tax=Hoylesella oralis ATCC 33269 TaxID=873533 RepID=E7RMD2_9BACT|nr:hypothetical protein HMPREF0663_10282 [Hoylesella oralis ATCC 33269]